MDWLTEDQRYFLARQGIDEDEVLDTSHLSSRQYKRAMERADLLFALVANPCYNGHSLRSRSGHCIQCDHTRIAFTRRHHEPNYVYIAGSKSARVVKVGSTSSPYDKDAYLNTRRWGGIADWRLLYLGKY
jgi:hypothetical protein